ERSNCRASEIARRDRTGDRARSPGEIDRKRSRGCGCLAFRLRCYDQDRQGGAGRIFHPERLDSSPGERSERVRHKNFLSEMRALLASPAKRWLEFKISGFMRPLRE